VAVSKACDGELSPAEILRADCSFVALGVASLATLRLIDTIESELGVLIDLADDMGFLADLDMLTGYLVSRGAAV
jgi:acyl carrier protein